MYLILSCIAYLQFPFSILWICSSPFSLQQFVCCLSSLVTAVVSSLGSLDESIDGCCVFYSCSTCLFSRFSCLACWRAAVFWSCSCCLLIGSKEVVWYVSVLHSCLHSWESLKESGHACHWHFNWCHSLSCSLSCWDLIRSSLCFFLHFFTWDAE